MKIINFYHFSLAALLFASVLTPAAQANIIRFDETSGIADGLSYGGVTFHYTVGGVPSSDAFFGAAYQFSDLLLQDYVLSGAAQDPNDPLQFGELTLTFDVPIHVFDFAIAFSTIVDTYVHLFLYDKDGNALPPQTIFATYDQANCAPASQICLAEAAYSYSESSAIKSAVLRLNGTNADTFALDNITTDLPEPSTWSLLAIGGLVFAWKKRRQRV